MLLFARRQERDDPHLAVAGQWIGDIWKNEGEKGAFYNVTITRSYKTADGWKHADSFSVNDLEAVNVVLGHAKVWIIERAGK